MFDQAGVGASADVEPAATSAAYAADCLRVGTQVLGATFGVAGVSLGGAAALTLALTEPRVVSWLVVACSFSGVTTFIDNVEPVPTRSVPPEGPQELLQLATQVIGSFSPGFLTSEPQAFWDIVRQTSETRLHPRLGESQIGQFVSHDVAEQLTDLRVPTRVVGGARDGTFSLANSADIARRIPQAALTVVPDADHALTFEAPGALADAIHDLAHPTA